MTVPCCCKERPALSATARSARLQEPSADAGERAADVRRDDEVLMVHFGQSLQHLGHWRIVNHQRNRFIIAGGGGHRQRQQQKQQAYPSHHVVSLHVASATLAVHIPKT